MSKSKVMMSGVGLLTLIGMGLAGVRAPAQEEPAIRQGGTSNTIKRLGKVLTPMERLERQVASLNDRVVSQQAEIEALKREVAEARAAFAQFSILDGHPRSHISKSEWDGLPGRSLIRVRPR